jgi:hypothetical protein
MTTPRGVPHPPKGGVTGAVTLKINSNDTSVTGVTEVSLQNHALTRDSVTGVTSVSVSG